MLIRIRGCRVVTSDGYVPAMPVKRDLDIDYGHLLVTVAVALHRLPGTAQKSCTGAEVFSATAR